MANKRLTALVATLLGVALMGVAPGRPGMARPAGATSGPPRTVTGAPPALQAERPALQPVRPAVQPERPVIRPDRVIIVNPPVRPEPPRSGVPQRPIPIDNNNASGVPPPG